MGDYTGLRFKGIVKKEFRDNFEEIAMRGEWASSSDKVLHAFGNYSRASFIPCGVLTYMPDEWEQAPYDEYGNGVATDGFERSYDNKTGRWTFQCSLKNYADTIEHFFKIVPYFIEKVDVAEVYFERAEYSCLYKLQNGEMILEDSKYRNYR